MGMEIQTIAVIGAGTMGREIAYAALAAGYRTTDITEPGTKTVSTSIFLENLHREMQRTFEHAEKYGWGV